MINELKCLVLFCFPTCEPCQDILMYCVVQKLSQFTCSWLIWSLSREMPSCSFCLPCFIPAARETVASHSVFCSLQCIPAAVPLQPFLCLFFHQGITVWSSFFSRSPLSRYISLTKSSAPWELEFIMLVCTHLIYVYLSSDLPEPLLPALQAEVPRG